MLSADQTHDLCLLVAASAARMLGMSGLQQSRGGQGQQAQQAQQAKVNQYLATAQRHYQRLATAHTGRAVFPLMQSSALGLLPGQGAAAVVKLRTALALADASNGEWV